MDNSPAFTSEDIDLIFEALNISWELHIHYHPVALGGKTERVNEIIKQYLTNLSIEVRLSWPSLLSNVLIHPWATPYSTTDLSPFVPLYRRLFLLNYHFPAQNPPVASQVCHTIFPSYVPISIDRLTTVSLIL